MSNEKLFCQYCGRSNSRTKFYAEYNTILCDSCYKMCQKYPMRHIPPNGEIHYDDDGNIICHECGRAFKKLTNHIKSKHNLTPYMYKEKFELNRGARLTGKNFIKNPTVDITIFSEGTRFKKNHKKSNHKRRLQAIKNKIGMKYNKGEN